MGRPKKSTSSPAQPELTQEQLDYFVEFAKTLNSFSPYFYNPYLQNQILKNTNMNPNSLSRDRVEQIVYDPKNNEQALRRLSEHLYNTQTPYMRLINYYADLLTFDNYILPTNAKPEDMTTDKFKKDYDLADGWFKKFNIKYELQKVLLGMLLEDAKFVYLTESDTGYTFIELPSDYCIIDSYSEYGWCFSFNMLYFTQPGTNINAFPPIFKKYYKNMLEAKQTKKSVDGLRVENRGGSWAYWQELSPLEGAFCFKFNAAFAGIVPPFLGLFIDAITIDNYKKLHQDKTTIENFKGIFGTVPRNKDNKSGNKTDDFAISATNLANFIQLVKGGLPTGIGFSAMPLENLTMMDFSGNANKANITADAIKNFYNVAGADGALFGSVERNNATGIEASKMIDEAFVTKLYTQFETFINLFMNKETKKYKFVCKLEGTFFDREKRYKQALEQAQSGIITPKLASSQGLSVKELNDGIALMQSMGFPDKLKPLQNAYQMSGKDDGGRPQKELSDLGDSGITTRDAGSNEDKQV